MARRKRSKSIIVPGYHLKPKYDLHYLRKIRTTNKTAHGAPDLPLVSLIDMFTILVIFLLMNFSATGEIFFIQKDVKLPIAKHARQITSAPLISITTTGVTLETEKVGDNPINVQESDQKLPKLAAALRQIKAQQELERPGQPFKGQINIQADENVPLIYIKRVMQTCVAEGWGGINFAVREPDSGG